MFIAFVIALVIGSVWNSMNGQDPGVDLNSGNSGASGTVGGSAPVAGNPTGSSSQSTINAEAQAGQELVVDIDEGSFQGFVLDSQEPVLVEFYTTHCPNCTKMADVLGQLAFNGQGVVRLCKVNAEKAGTLADRYDVNGVPTFVLFSEGHMVDSTAGARSFEDMRSWLSQNNISVPAKVGSSGHQVQL